MEHFEEASLVDNSFNPTNFEGRSLTLLHRNVTINLSLRRNRDVENEVPIILSSGGDYHQWKNGPELISYIDRESGASIIMQVNQTEEDGSPSYVSIWYELNSSNFLKRHNFFSLN